MKRSSNPNGSTDTDTDTDTDSGSPPNVSPDRRGENDNNPPTSGSDPPSEQPADGGLPPATEGSREIRDLVEGDPSPGGGGKPERRLRRLFDADDSGAIEGDELSAAKRDFDRGALGLDSFRVLERAFDEQREVASGGPEVPDRDASDILPGDAPTVDTSSNGTSNASGAPAQAEARASSGGAQAGTADLTQLPEPLRDDARELRQRAGRESDQFVASDFRVARGEDGESLQVAGVTKAAAAREVRGQLTRQAVANNEPVGPGITDINAADVRFDRGDIELTDDARREVAAVGQSFDASDLRVNRLDNVVRDREAVVDQFRESTGAERLDADDIRQTDDGFALTSEGRVEAAAANSEQFDAGDLVVNDGEVMPTLDARIEAAAAGSDDLGAEDLTVEQTEDGTIDVVLSDRGRRQRVADQFDDIGPDDIAGVDEQGRVDFERQIRETERGVRIGEDPQFVTPGAEEDQDVITAGEMLQVRTSASDDAPAGAVLGTVDNVSASGEITLVGPDGERATGGTVRPELDVIQEDERRAFDSSNVFIPDKFAGDEVDILVGGDKIGEVDVGGPSIGPSGRQNPDVSAVRDETGPDLNLEDTAFADLDGVDGVSGRERAVAQAALDTEQSASTVAADVGLLEQRVAEEPASTDGNRDGFDPTGTDTTVEVNESLQDDSGAEAAADEIAATDTVVASQDRFDQLVEDRERDARAGRAAAAVAAERSGGSELERDIRAARAAAAGAAERSGGSEREDALRDPTLARGAVEARLDARRDRLGLSKDDEQFGDIDFSLGLGGDEDEVEQAVDALPGAVRDVTGRVPDEVIDVGRESLETTSPVFRGINPAIDAADRATGGQTSRSVNQGLRDAPTAVADVPGQGLELAELGVFTTDATVAAGGSEEEFDRRARRVGEAAAGQARLAGEFARDNPVRFGTSLVASSVAEAGAVGALTRAGSAGRLASQGAAPRRVALSDAADTFSPDGSPPTRVGGDGRLPTFLADERGQADFGRTPEVLKDDGGGRDTPEGTRAVEEGDQLVLEVEEQLTRDADDAPAIEAEAREQLAPREAFETEAEFRRELEQMMGRVEEQRTKQEQEQEQELQTEAQIQTGVNLKTFGAGAVLTGQETAQSQEILADQPERTTVAQEVEVEAEELATQRVGGALDTRALDLEQKQESLLDTQGAAAQKQQSRLDQRQELQQDQRQELLADQRLDDQARQQQELELQQDQRLDQRQKLQQDQRQELLADQRLDELTIQQQELELQQDQRLDQRQKLQQDQRLDTAARTNVRTDTRTNTRAETPTRREFEFDPSDDRQDERVFFGEGLISDDRVFDTGVAQSVDEALTRFDEADKEGADGGAFDFDFSRF